jgi:uncharacterized protein (DUF433 family)
MSERIIIDPNICNGKPTIRGTRITVQTIVEFLSEGDSIADVLEEYSQISREDVQACLEYMAKRM